MTQNSASLAIANKSENGQMFHLWHYTVPEVQNISSTTSEKLSCGSH